MNMKSIEQIAYEAWLGCMGPVYAISAQWETQPEEVHRVWRTVAKAVNDHPDSGPGEPMAVSAAKDTVHVKVAVAVSSDGTYECSGADWRKDPDGWFRRNYPEAAIYLLEYDLEKPKSKTAERLLAYNKEWLKQSTLTGPKHKTKPKPKHETKTK